MLVWVVLVWGREGMSRCGAVCVCENGWRGVCKRRGAAKRSAQVGGAQQVRACKDGVVVGGLAGSGVGVVCGVVELTTAPEYRRTPT